MDAPPPTSDLHAPAGFVAVPQPRHVELLVEALKVALTTPGEHRLFRAGKLSGLFPARSGTAGEAATLALQEGLLETARTEAKGKLVTEWVRATPRAVGFVHEHDSTRSILRELKEVLNATQSAVPAFMLEAKAELTALSATFAARANEMLSRLDDLSKRCEAALRRVEAGREAAVAEPVSRVVPWAVEALEYLDKRTATGATGDCPLPDLFGALCERFPDLTLPAFHDGLKRLHDVRALRLKPAAEMGEPEYAVVADGRLMYAASR
jgi:hypothetical protein